MNPKEKVKESLGTIFKKGLLSWVIPQYKTDDSPDVVDSKFKQWRERQLERAKTFVGETFAETTQEDEVQEAGIRAVKNTLTDGVSEIRSELPQAIESAKDNLKPFENRPNYERFRDILGYKSTDKWYTKIFKSGGARLLSWGAVPLLSHVSARVAAQASTGGGDLRAFQNNFSGIFSGLLSRWSGEVDPNAPAPGAAPAAGTTQATTGTAPAATP